MAVKRLNNRDIAEIVKLRGLGFSQTDIGKRLGVKQSAVQYQLARINKRARNEGIEDVFLALIVSSVPI